MKKQITLTARDGLELAITVFSPQGIPKAGVIINSATAVKQGYYESFASFLAEHGYLVITYDYRGIGASSIKTRETND
jgi:predicted alpha/beta hydrolase